MNERWRLIGSAPGGELVAVFAKSTLSSSNLLYSLPHGSCIDEVVTNLLPVPWACHEFSKGLLGFMNCLTPILSVVAVADSGATVPAIRDLTT